MAQQFRLQLKSGPDNLKPYKEDASQSFKRGEVLKVTDTTEVAACTGSFDSGILGVAAADGQNTTTPSDKAQVYVISLDQVWALHVNSAKKPTSYSIGANYKIKQTSNASFTITRENEASSTTVSMRGPVLLTSAATANEGAVVVGYIEGTKAKKGQQILVRFPGEATINK